MSASEGRALMEIGAIRTLSREGYQYYLKVLAGMLGALLVTCSDRAFNSYCMEPRYVAVPISCIGGGAGGTRHGSRGVGNFRYQHKFGKEAVKPSWDFPAAIPPPPPPVQGRPRDRPGGSESKCLGASIISSGV